MVALLKSLLTIRMNEIFRSSRREVFCKKSVLVNFAKFTGKHLCQSLFCNKVVAGYNYIHISFFICAFAIAVIIQVHNNSVICCNLWGRILNAVICINMILNMFSNHLLPSNKITQTRYLRNSGEAVRHFYLR